MRSRAMEVVSFDAGEEVVRMHKYGPHETAPLITVTSPNNPVSCRRHQRLDQAFQGLFGQLHHFDLTLDKTTAEKLENPCGDHLQFLQNFLSNKLFEAFSFTKAERFECHVNCSRVTIGGFGGTWHHDATSQLTTENGTVCEYLALYYLNEKEKIGNYKWLECALVTQDYPNKNQLLESFCPVSTTDGQLLVLRNDCMMHRTPVLCNLVPGSVRRFFYVPFRALDSSNQPVLLEPPSTAVWKPYQESTIQERIVDELKSHDSDIDLPDYIVNGNASLTIPWSEEIQSERPNWLFDDPDDY